MLPDHNFWHGRSVFVSGHTGFKGTWLCLWLVKMGAKVTGYSLPLSDDNIFFENMVFENEIHHIAGDINNYDDLKFHIEKSEPDVIFHLAAQAIVAQGYKDPLGTWQTNLQGSANILQAVHDAKLRQCAVVMVTTDKVYKNLDQGKLFKETDPLGGHDPYSASKAGAEILIDSWANSYKELWVERSNKLISARGGNVIGGGDWSNARIMPDLARAFSKNETLFIRSPSSTRPWQYVLDVLNGYLCLAQKSYYDISMHGSAWNIGPNCDEEKTVQDVLDYAVTLWEGRVEYNDEQLFKEAKILQLDNEKIVSEIGWRPVYSFETSIRQTVSWYKNATNGMTQKDLSNEDIEFFYAHAKKMELI